MDANEADRVIAETLFEEKDLARYADGEIWIRIGDDWQKAAFSTDYNQLHGAEVRLTLGQGLTYVGRLTEVLDLVQVPIRVLMLRLRTAPADVCAVEMAKVLKGKQ